MVYTYYDYLGKYYESYYENYYESYYWPHYYGNFNGSNTTYNGTYPPSPYQYHAPYNMAYVTPLIFTTSVVGAILSIFITVSTIYKMRSAKRKNRLTAGLTLLCISLHLVQNIIDPICYYAWYLNYDATTNRAWDIEMVWDFVWCLAKLSLYVLFIYRYWMVFKATPAAATKQKYIIFGMFVCAMLTQFTLHTVYLIYGYFMTDDQLATDSASVIRTYLNVSWAFLALDAVLICVLGYLLCRSVLQLVISIRKIDHEHRIAPFHLMTPTATVTVHMESSMQTSKPTGNTTSNNGSQVSEFADGRRVPPPSPRMASNTTDECVSPPPPNTPRMMSNITESGVEPCDSGYLDTGVKMVQMSRTFSFPSETRIAEPRSVESNEVTVHKQKRQSKEEKRLHHLLHTATRIAVTMLISMVSSCFYQVLWILAVELKHDIMMCLTWTWCIDGVINMLCVYLSMSFAGKHYKRLCSDVCKFHPCILGCIQKIVAISAK